MDLATLDLTKHSNEGAWINLKHPVTDEELPIKIKILGKDSDKFNQLTEEFRRTSIEEMKSNKTDAQKIDAAKEYGEKLLVACTVDWEGVELEGKALEFNEDNVKSLYKRFSWIKEQVDIAIANRANFIKP